MSEVQRHYDDLLAAHYSWMSGMTFTEKVREQRNMLEKLGFPTRLMGCALDLGCGPGYQTIALSDIGYETVIAFDTSQTLLDELNAASQGRPIQAIFADLRDFPTIISEGDVDAIVCMGDTLTHLESRADVSKLLQDAYRVLRPGGRLVLTFRDFSIELTGTDRFIPVRSGDQRIMLCALVYEPDHVGVSDLVYLRSEDGWQLHKSSYRKLRLRPSSIADELRQFGFSVEVDAPISKMHTIVACKR